MRDYRQATQQSAAIQHHVLAKLHTTPGILAAAKIMDSSSSIASRPAPRRYSSAKRTGRCLHTLLTWHNGTLPLPFASHDPVPPSSITRYLEFWWLAVRPTDLIMHIHRLSRCFGPVSNAHKLYLRGIYAIQQYFPPLTLFQTPSITLIQSFPLEHLCAKMFKPHLQVESRTAAVCRAEAVSPRPCRHHYAASASSLMQHSFTMRHL